MRISLVYVRLSMALNIVARSDQNDVAVTRALDISERRGGQ
jgi:hypothetical protein